MMSGCSPVAPWRLLSVITVAALSGSLSVNAATEKLYPVETVHLGWGSKLLARFDLTRIKNPDSAKAVVLRLESGRKEPAGTLRVREVMGAWGAMCQEFQEQAAQPFWTDERAEMPGYKAIPLLFTFGDPTSSEAARGCRTWKTSGGDFGEVLATIRCSNGATTADVTRLYERWVSAPVENFGILIEMADAEREPRLNYCSVLLEFDSPALVYDESLQIDRLPSWLPKTYKIEHPRFPHPTKKWLDGLKTDPQRLAEVCQKADSFDPEKGHWTKIVPLLLAVRLSPSPERLQKLSGAAGAPYPNHGHHTRAYALSVLYDWGYDLLEPSDRRRLAARLERLCTSQEAGSAGTLISPYNDVGTSRFGCGLLWAALAIYPDNPAAIKHLWRAKAYYVDTSIPVWHQIMGDHGGFWHEIHSYYLQSCIGTALDKVLTVWSSATGEDLYEKHPWLENVLYFPLYATRPDMHRIRYGDVKTSLYYYTEDAFVLNCFPALANRYDNPYGRWWLQRAGRGRYQVDGWTPSEWPWGEPFAEHATLESWDSLPPVRHADGLGMVVMRSDWSEDATYVWFKCGPSFWSHSHQDCGHFAIYKRGNLAIKSGTYAAGTGSEHKYGYAINSIAHNVVTVTDPAENPYTFREFTFPNDGGQRYSTSETGVGAPYSLPEWQTRADTFEAGEIVAFQPTEQFTYVAGDLTKAYTNRKSGSGDAHARNKRVRQMLRSLVYLPPDHLIVFDQVESFDKGFEKRWLLHTINEPEISGNLITAERGDLVFKGRGWDEQLEHTAEQRGEHPFYAEHPDCKYANGAHPQLYQYDGIMFVRTLLPADPVVTKIGGDGKECWVSGKNWVGMRSGRDLSFRPYTGEAEAGRWRVEVCPAERAEKDLFLHVIQVGLGSRNPEPTVARCVKVEAGTRVDVDLGDGRGASIVFEDGIGGTICISGGSGPTIEESLAENVLPNIPIPR